MSIVLAGFLLGISLIVAMGPQNILLIKQGIRKEGITAVILVCIVSDVILYTTGAFGMGAITTRYPLALDILKVVGVIYLAWFAFLSLRDALFPRSNQGVQVVEEAQPTTLPEEGTGDVALKTRTTTHTAQRTGTKTWVRPALAALALTWLNPGAYLDGMVMIGGYSMQYGTTGRWAFIAGALAASVLWFTAVGYGAGKLSGPLSRPIVWRWLNAAFGIILIALCVKLALL
ncbi:MULTISPECIES: LysE/ArgO family amino acid transporter [unclassified Corynebacterium]|uniref:LysE/ArgO family amino acid transporter n=1 Tax=unclassified Corynebacterium TaxID=2624378 RepID=UPI0029CAA281|nr:MULTISPECIES: LysE family transporter [unclassified Corynebacterium]WPF67050.1 LysE family transporter [Corynebacterium sp. 22KM0430]WPF69538.1 LysE family transporter [Corynebacterium sp. 21KM1197]